MSLQRNTDQVNVITAQTITAATETVVVTGPTLTTPKDVWTNVIQWYISIALGTLATTLTIRVRKNSLTGAVVGNPQAITTTASTTIQQFGMAIDTGSFTASALYVVTVQQIAGSGNATVNEAVILVETF